MATPSGEEEDGGEHALPFDPERTTLITGGTGGLGSLFARHLATEYGARRLLLVSRSGEGAEGAKELRAELEGLGAEVEIVSCDVSVRKELASLLDSIPAERPLGTVVHAAGALADATVQSLDREGIERVFTPKADAAWHLHELTKEAQLSTFLTLSSAAGTFGGPGQGNYAAANVFLDALAYRRRAEGLAGTSVAWGAWAEQAGMLGRLKEADRKRIDRVGIGALSTKEGLALFDAALEAERPLAVAIRLDPKALRTLAQAGMMPPLLRGLIRTPARRAAAGGSLAIKLAGLPEAEHERVVLELVRAEVAAVLGHGSSDAIDPGQALGELGFDSLAALELRNGLELGTGLQLPATLVFDYPTAAAITEYLLGKARPEGGSDAEAELTRLERVLAAIPSDDPGRSGLAGRLRTLVANFEGDPGVGARTRAKEAVESASDEELLRFIDEQVESTPTSDPTTSDR